MENLELIPKADIEAIEKATNALSNMKEAIKELIAAIESCSILSDKRE